jgi:hypothetical protein
VPVGRWGGSRNEDGETERQRGLGADVRVHDLHELLDQRRTAISGRMSDRSGATYEKEVGGKIHPWFERLTPAVTTDMTLKLCQQIIVNIVHIVHIRPHVINTYTRVCYSAVPVPTP